MRTLVYEKQTEMPCSAEALFRWHEQPNAFHALMPPGTPVKVIRHDGHVRDGAKAVLRVGRWPFCFRWELEHRGYQADRRFCDEQVRGPFSIYRHEHLVKPIDGRRSILHDRITFALPFGPIGAMIGRMIVMREFERLFTFRHEATRRALA